MMSVLGVETETVIGIVTIVVNNRLPMTTEGVATESRFTIGAPLRLQILLW